MITQKNLTIKRLLDNLCFLSKRIQVIGWVSKPIFIRFWHLCLCFFINFAVE